MKRPPADRAFRRRLLRGRLAWGFGCLVYAAFLYFYTSEFSELSVRLFLASPIAYGIYRIVLPLGPKSFTVVTGKGETLTIYAIEYDPENVAPSPWGLAAKVAGFVFVAPALFMNEIDHATPFLWKLAGVGFVLTIVGSFAAKKRSGYLSFTPLIVEILDGAGKPVVRIDRDAVRVHEYATEASTDGEGEPARVEFSLPSQDGRGPYRVRVAAKDAERFRRDLGANYSKGKLAA